ncbi:MAG TPA: DUF427 domain-containing protein [Trebonia sp.]|jgi:uncharacterized protein (DUF427 family)|nr:DUF427 domain-containing protein [Trebonia sp.]
MGLSWQQGPLSGRSVGHFLTAEPLPERLLFAEPLRRRMRVRFGEAWIADSEDVILLHEPGRYPVAFFPHSSVAAGTLRETGLVTQHRELGETTWFAVTAGETADGADGASAERAAWEYRNPPEYAKILQGRVAFAWRAMDAFYEEDERILGHAADAYHRIDIRITSRHLTVTAGGQVVAETHAPLVLYESGFAPRWYVPRADVAMDKLTPAKGQTFCPYKGVCSYYDLQDGPRGAWSYLEPYAEVGRVGGYVSFEPDHAEVLLDGTRLHLEPGQTVVPHGVDRGLDIDEIDTRHHHRG